MINKIFSRLLGFSLMMVATILPYLAMAQPNPGDNPDAPIDGGLTILLAAGVGYGVKKYREGRKNRAGEERE